MALTGAGNMSRTGDGARGRKDKMALTRWGDGYTWQEKTHAVLWFEHHTINTHRNIENKV